MLNNRLLLRSTTALVLGAAVAVGPLDLAAGAILGLAHQATSAQGRGNDSDDGDRGRGRDRDVSDRNDNRGGGGEDRQADRREERQVDRREDRPGVGNADFRDDFDNHGERVRVFVAIAQELGLDANVGAPQANFGTPHERGVKPGQGPQSDWQTVDLDVNRDGRVNQIDLAAARARP